MPKFAVTIAQTLEEYQTVTIEAESAKAAEAQVQRLIDATAPEDERAYAALVAGHWDIGETHDTRVVDTVLVAEA